MATNQTVVRGDTWRRTATFSGSLSGATVWLTIKRSYSQSDENALVQIVSTAPSALGEIVISGTTAEITLFPAATNNARPGTYVYDIQVEFSPTDISTAESGAFTITSDVTRTTI